MSSMKKLNTKKIFVTGIYGSGKTTFARKYARKYELKYFSLDQSFNYRSNKNQSKEIINNLPNTFVIDAIPIDERATWSDFIEYEKGRNDITVVCVYCPDINAWLKRVGRRAIYFNDTPGAVKHIIKRILGKKVTPRNVEELKKNYRDFFTGNIPALKKFSRVKYYNSITNNYSSLDTMCDQIKFKTFDFQEYLYQLPDGYDKYYQDIEIIDFKGYSESYKTWGIIKNIANWKGKKVVDLGCFHGYFSFKIENQGAKVIGLEKSEEVIKTAEFINRLRGGKVKFSQWEDGRPIPPADIILCLNVLHHFKDPQKAIRQMRAEKIIFEINQSNRQIIEDNLSVVEELPSQRINRVILLCRPKKKKE